MQASTRRSSTSASWATSSRLVLARLQPDKPRWAVACQTTWAALTINKVCGSGLKAVMLAAQGIATGDVDVTVAGGMESMSNCPYLLPNAREGMRMGNAEAVDSMIHDGLWCSLENWSMGLAGEAVAEKYQVSRDDQDAFAAGSHHKAATAIRECWFKDEILPVEIPQRKGDPMRLEYDESVRPDTSVEALARLKPAFKKNGSVTAGNAPGVNDGAAALVVMGSDISDGAGSHTDGPHRRPVRERVGTEVAPHDAGSGRRQAVGQGWDGSWRTST